MMLPRNSPRRRERGMGSSSSRVGAPGGGPSSLPGTEPQCRGGAQGWRGGGRGWNRQIISQSGLANL